LVFPPSMTSFDFFFPFSLSRRTLPFCCGPPASLIQCGLPLSPSRVLPTCPIPPDRTWLFPRLALSNLPVPHGLLSSCSFAKGSCHPRPPVGLEKEAFFFFFFVTFLAPFSSPPPAGHRNWESSPLMKQLEFFFLGLLPMPSVSVRPHRFPFWFSRVQA